MVWIIVMFLSAVWTHILTAPIHIHCWASDVMLHFSKSDEETNLSLSWMDWGWEHVQQFVFWVNYSFKELMWWCEVGIVCMFFDDRWASRTVLPLCLCCSGIVLSWWFQCRLSWIAFRVCASEFGWFAFTAAARVYRSTWKKNWLSHLSLFYYSMHF